MPTDPSELVVAICTPTAGHPSWEFHRSNRMLWRPSMREGSMIPGRCVHHFDLKGYSTELARQYLTRAALDADPRTSHVLFIDDDMSFPQDALRRLLSHDVSIVGGLCHNRHHPYHPILGRKLDPHWGMGDNAYGFVYDYPPDTLFEVDVTGGAFILIKREVFEAIEEKYGPIDGEDCWWRCDDGSTAEDFAFCRRAQGCGYKILVDTGLDIGHRAEVVINAERAQRLRTYRWRAWNPADLPEHEGEPKASVVIPTYNQSPKYLLAAVHSALAQTVPVEVIVVDDGTTDYPLLKQWETYRETPQDSCWWGAKARVGEAYHPPVDQCVYLPEGVRLVRHEDRDNRGIANALNAGIRAMSTEWFCWLSSDDLLSPQKVEIQLAALQQSGLKCSYHSYDSIGPGAASFQPTSVATPWTSVAQQMQRLQQVCAINGSTVMIHRDVLEEARLESGAYFDPAFKYGQDYEMWCRIGQRHLFLPIIESLGTRRTGENLTAKLAQEGGAEQARRDAEDIQIRKLYGSSR